MEEQKCTWVGPEGVNSILGYVTRGQDLFLSSDRLEYFQTHGLVELPKKETPKEIPEEKKIVIVKKSKK